MSPRALRVRRRRRRKILSLIGGTVLCMGAWLLVDAWEALGHRPSAEDWRRMGASVQQQGGRFENPEPIENHMWAFFVDLPDVSAAQSPEQPIRLYEAVVSELKEVPTTDARVTWMGHSTVLIELDGARLLTDPVWGPVAGPWAWAGPRRFYAPPVSLDELGPLDAVLISHDHYDHLDHPTIVALAQVVPRFIVPLGVGAHLRYWGVAPEKITEVDWWDVVEIEGVKITATPARHASGRQVFDKDRTLWCGYALAGSTNNLYFSGDTGMFPGLREIGARLGPFDLAMIEVGAYNRAWPDWHIGPEQ
ncbi:MAG: MBL fold metallo-hydrolase, partial [Nannocystaceae bacterium]